MSCFGGLSQVLSNIGQVLRLHCGTIVCAPGGSGQEAAEQLPLAGRGSAQEAGDDSSAAAAAAATAAAAAKGMLFCLLACWIFTVLLVVVLIVIVLLVIVLLVIVLLVIVLLLDCC